MTWVKLGDEFSEAARDLSDSAVRTHVEGLIWSARRLLDLTIPKRDVRRFAETVDADTAVEELVTAGWWQDLGDAGWYIGCRFADWQQERAVVEHRRAEAALRQRRSRLHRAGDHSLCQECAVTRDATRAGGREITRDPGRVGTGRDGNRQLPPGPEDQTGPTTAAAEHGVTCPCADCAEERTYWETSA